MEHSPAFRKALFLTLYFAQGALLNYFLNYNSTYLHDTFGINEREIGLFGLVLMLPFVLKILIGILSDKVNLLRLGHRKPYMILGLLMQSAGFFLVSFVSPVVNPGLFALVSLLAVTGMATYDTATDGYALDTTPAAEQGRVQGLMVTGRALGLFVLTPLIGTTVKAFGWTVIFTGGALILLLPLGLVLCVREDPAACSRAPFQWRAFRGLASPHRLFFSLFGALSALVIMSLPPFLNLYFTGKDAPYLGIGVGAAGWIFLVMGLGRVAGALVAGRITDRIGLYRSTWLCLGLTGIACFGVAALTGLALPMVARPAALAHPAVIALVLAGFLLSVGYSYYDTVYFCGAMRLAEPAVYASMYALFMAAGNIGAALGQPLTGAIAGHPALGFPVAALVVGLINLLNIPLVVRVFGTHLSAAQPIKE